MRKLPMVLAGAFIAITLFRVATFAAERMGGGWPGWVFSVGLGLGVYLSAYWTRDSVSRRELVKDGTTILKDDRRNSIVKKWAWGLLLFFVIADSLFNLAEVWFTVDPPMTDWLLVIATAVYGLFPTMGAAGLGALQGHIDRLPIPPANTKTSIGLAMRKKLVAMIDKQPQPEPQPAETKEQPKQQNSKPGKKEMILSLHKAQPGLKPSELAKMTGVTRQYVDRVVNARNAHKCEPVAIASEPAPPNGKAH